MLACFLLCVELPQVKIGSLETVVDVGDDVTMTCTARETPPPVRLYWLDDKQNGEYSVENLTVSYTQQYVVLLGHYFRQMSPRPIRGGVPRLSDVAPPSRGGA